MYTQCILELYCVGTYNYDNIRHFYIEIVIFELLVLI